MLTIAAASTVTLVHLGKNSESSVTAEPPPAETSPPGSTPLSPPTAEEKFIAEMRGYGVPVSEQDPGWTVDRAHDICALAQDEGPEAYPPGTHTVGVFIEGVTGMNPDWTRQQATRFTHGAVNYFCLDLWGPSKQEIDAMPPDDRYLARLQDRLGIVPVDGSIVRVGHQICTAREQGFSTEAIVDEMNSVNSREDELLIVDIATDVLCPQYR